MQTDASAYSRKQRRSFSIQKDNYRLRIAQPGEAESKAGPWPFDPRTQHSATNTDWAYAKKADSTTCLSLRCRLLGSSSQGV